MEFGERMRDLIKEKSKEISDTLGEKYRGHVGEELAQREDRVRVRESELTARAKKLDEREVAIEKREKELRRYFLIRRAYVIAPLLIVVLAAIGASVFFLRAAGVGGGTASPTGLNSGEPISASLVLAGRAMRCSGDSRIDDCQFLGHDH